MKKILCLILALLMVLSMAACSTTNTDPSDSTPAESQPQDSKPEDSKPEESKPAESGITEINVADYLSDESKWEDDGYHEFKDGTLLFDNFMSGDFCAMRLKEEAQNVSYKFKLTINKLAPVSMDDWTWWDSELLIIARSTIPAASWYDDLSQKGYTLTSWGDMSTVFIGRCGYDDAFGEFAWNVNDGQAHDIELKVVNNADNTQVTITLLVDGVEVASVVDDGTKIKNDRPALYPDAGGLTIRCKWLEATIG